MSILRDIRRWRFWRRFATYTFSGIGALAVIAGIVDVFSPGALADKKWLIWVGVLLSAAYGAFSAWPRPVTVRFQSPLTRISVVPGDFFEETGNLVIGACDTFDTASPHIAPGSIQGQFLTKVYGGNVALLDQDLAAGLANAALAGVVHKEGKQQRYELGTVVPLRNLQRRFFFLAYTTMDSVNKAHGTVDGLWKSLGNLWPSVRTETNGAPVSITVLGGGQSGLSRALPAEDAIRFTALSFVVASRAERVCEELRIVVRPEQYDRLNHIELQAFLSGLARVS